MASLTSLHAGYDICNTPLTSHRPVVGPAIGLTKKILRQLVTPILRRQVAYNAANTRVVTHLKQQSEALAQQQAQLRTQLKQQGEALAQQQAQLQQHGEQLQQQGEAMGQQEAQITRQGEVLGQQQAHLRHDVLSRQEAALVGIRGRVSSVERRLRRVLSLLTGGQEEASPAQVETKGVIRQALDEDFDYFGLEERFRGSEEQIKDRQRMYLDYFQGREEVLDIGCGRGEFLELLRGLGIKARGADIDTDMGLLCRKGVSMSSRRTPSAVLQKLPDESLGGIFAAQVIEHFPPDQIIRLVRRCYQKIRPGPAWSFWRPQTPSACPYSPAASTWISPTSGLVTRRRCGTSWSPSASRRFGSCSPRPCASSLGIPPVADARLFGEHTDRFNRTATVLNSSSWGRRTTPLLVGAEGESAKSGRVQGRGVMFQWKIAVTEHGIRERIDAPAAPGW